MILGINYSSYHDSSIAIVNFKNVIQFAASEERYSRVKKDGRFPIKSLTKIDFNKIDYIAIPYLEYLSTIEAYKDPLFEDIFYHSNNLITPFPDIWLENISLLDKPTFFFDHHDSHAAAGIYFSGFEKCNIITSDFGADNTASSTAIFKYTSTDGLNKIHSDDIRIYEPLCSIYTFTTAILGFKPNEHEGKLTGLAATSETNLEAQIELESVFKDFLKVRNSLDVQLFQWEGRWNSNISPGLIINNNLSNKIRNKLSKFSDASLARAAQDIIENKMLALLEKSNINKNENLILSGGIFSNVKLNLSIKNIGFKSVYVCPPMGDEGLAIGSAILLNQLKHSIPLHINQSAKSSLSGIFSGSDTNNNDLNSLSNIITSSSPENLPLKIAEILANNYSVAIVRGKMEFGPRSLGHRSILHNASNSTINESLNRKLNRSEFMPFAPVMRIESAKDCLDFNDIDGAYQTAKYMTICIKATSKFKQLCPAVVHVDGTCRPQLVEQDTDPFLYKLLEYYEKITGLPALINTSYNIHEQPIVCSLEDALITFIYSDLDFLLYNDKLISQYDIGNIKNILNLINPSLISCDKYNFNILELEFWKNKYYSNQVLLDDHKKHILNLEEILKER